MHVKAIIRAGVTTLREVLVKCAQAIASSAATTMP